MSAHHSTYPCLPLKTVLGKIRERYQDYCTTYKTHATATHHGGAGCPHNIQILTMKAHTAPDATVALGGPEAVGHPEDQVHSKQDKLTALTRKINDFYQ